MENSQNISVNYDDLIDMMRTAIEEGISDIQETVNTMSRDIDEINKRLDKLAKRSRCIHLNVKKLTNNSYSDYDDI
jgi:hypothetical protein